MKVEPLGIQHTEEAVRLRQRSEFGRGVGHTLPVEALQVIGYARILPRLKGMIRERMQLREWDLDDYILLRFWLFGWRGLHSQHLHPRHGGDEALRRRCHRKRHQSGDVTTKNSGRGADDAIRPSPVLSCPLGFWVKQKTPKCRVTI